MKSELLLLLLCDHYYNDASNEEVKNSILYLASHIFSNEPDTMENLSVINICVNPFEECTISNKVPAGFQYGFELTKNFLNDNHLDNIRD